MALDLTKTAALVYDASTRFRAQRHTRLTALAEAVRHAQTAHVPAIEARRRAGRATWLVAGLEACADLCAPFEAGPLPPEHAVIAVDGSHIDVDRHSPVHSFLINIGRVVLRYGEVPSAELGSEPYLFADESDLVLRDPAGTREQPIEGPLLGIVRSVMEVEALADLVERSDPGVPTLALLDGTLVLWGLSGQTYPDYVREGLLRDRFLPAMERLQLMAQDRLLAVAAHVSLPRSTDVVNALRISEGVCRHPQVNCDRNCGGAPRGNRNCDVVAGVTDADLFAALLDPGQRSSLFRSTSSIVEDYGLHAVRFCYVHLGEEIARLELPAWVSEDALAFAHAAILAQSAKGHGYPLALQEAHEQAVVTGTDREYFQRLVQEALAGEHLTDATSQKARSKRTRWV